MQGQGRLTYADGSVYEGAFRADQPEGKGKITYPRLMGLEGARRALAEATEQAIAHLQTLPAPGSLVAWARFLAERSA